MERRINILPAFDRRHPDPKQNYGIHSAEMRFYLIGSEAVWQALEEEYLLRFATVEAP